MFPRLGATTPQSANNDHASVIVRIAGSSPQERETMSATITSPDGVFAFGVFNGVILTWCVMTVARKLKHWDARNKR